ncbi:MAG: C_GCAxxG_C_C family protein [Bacteroidales bacterium]|nr:MAG: C_GCAxxG_C_C family protein [Bacteroidales bacterium]
MNEIETSLQLFKNGSSCAQAILEAYAKRVNINSELAVKIGSGLGGGVGRKQHICGAVNAGAIILGLKNSNGISGDIESKERTSQIVSNYISECEKTLGSIQCKDLLKIDLSNPAERIAAKEAGIFEIVCNNAVKQAAIILDKHLTQ